jgi:hypothetical protein
MQRYITGSETMDNIMAALIMLLFVVLCIATDEDYLRFKLSAGLLAMLFICIIINLIPN